MNRYLVKVRTEAGEVSYTAIARHIVDAMFSAYDLYGACGVSVRRLP